MSLFDDKLKGGLNKDIFDRYLSIIQYEGNMEEVEWILEEMKAREVGIDDFTIFQSCFQIFSDLSSKREM